MFIGRYFPPKRSAFLSVRFKPARKGWAEGSKLPKKSMIKKSMKNLLVRFTQGNFGNDPLANYQ